MAFGFIDPKVGTLKVKVAVDSDTNIKRLILIRHAYKPGVFVNPNKVGSPAN